MVSFSCIYRIALPSKNVRQPCDFFYVYYKATNFFCIYTNLQGLHSKHKVFNFNSSSKVLVKVKDCSRVFIHGIWKIGETRQHVIVNTIDLVGK